METKRFFQQTFPFNDEFNLTNSVFIFSGNFEIIFRRFCGREQICHCYRCGKLNMKEQQVYMYITDNNANYRLTDVKGVTLRGFCRLFV